MQTELLFLKSQTGMSSFRLSRERTLSRKPILLYKVWSVNYSSGTVAHTQIWSSFTAQNDRQFSTRDVHISVLLHMMKFGKVFK